MRNQRLQIKKKPMSYLRTVTRLVNLNHVNSRRLHSKNRRDQHLRKMAAQQSSARQYCPLNYHLFMLDRDDQLSHRLDVKGMKAYRITEPQNRKHGEQTGLSHYQTWAGIGNIFYQQGLHYSKTLSKCLRSNHAKIHDFFLFYTE